MSTRTDSCRSSAAEAPFACCGVGRRFDDRDVCAQPQRNTHRTQFRAPRRKLRRNACRCRKKYAVTDAHLLVLSREHLSHLLAEAAELEHNLMCTYLYAAFSLKRRSPEFSADEARAVERFRSTLLGVAVEEMGHLASVWNITSALGATPQLGRSNFPLDPGVLPAGLVVKLVPFNEASLQHFIHLERPAASDEPEGRGFESTLSFRRARTRGGLVPMSLDYETVGEFYAYLQRGLLGFAAEEGEAVAFAGTPSSSCHRPSRGCPGSPPCGARRRPSRRWMPSCSRARGRRWTLWALTSSASRAFATSSRGSAP